MSGFTGVAVDIQGVILSNDLLVWAEKAGAQFHRAGSEWRSCCPLHHGDNREAFAVYMDAGKQKWKCFTHDCGCGDILDFVMKWQNCDTQTAYQMLGGEAQPDPAAVAKHAAEQAARTIADLENKMIEAQRVLDELRRAQSWLTYHQNLAQSEPARQMWRKRGLPDDWQDFWELGYCPRFSFISGGAHISSPTLAIPIKDNAAQVVNIRHRILQPIDPKDKYRPDRPGLAASPFIGYPGLEADRVIVIEGEIKSAVTFMTLWQENDPIQVIGIPGKNAFHAVADSVMGHDVYICFDPDADEQAREAAALVKGKVMTMPVKIDDAILAGSLDRKSILFRMKAARRI